jgi:zinc transport system substrate-binding protein
LPAGAAPKVVVSILPIHSLVAGVMQGVAEPTLLVPVGASPHTYAMKPSDARVLQSADVVVWIGEHLETYLEKPLESLAGKATIVEVIAIPGIDLLTTRRGGAFEPHVHTGHSHGHSHGKKGGHAEPEPDVHLWLDPDNARVIVAEMVALLSRIDTANAAKYAANGKALDARLAALDTGIKTRLAPVRDRAYIVFHDAYQYFERHFGTRIVGALTVSPDQAPSAKRVTELRKRIRTASAVCVFREPQFPAPIVDTLTSGTGAKVGVLDPEGADLDPGPDAYLILMDRIADSLVDCLKAGV